MDSKKEDRTKELATSLGAAIARMRTKAGLTQEEAAEALGVGNDAISRMERGTAIPNALRLYDIADVYNCFVDQLLIGASDRQLDQSKALFQRFMRLSYAERQFFDAMLSMVENGDFWAGLPNRERRTKPNRSKSK